MSARLPHPAAQASRSFTLPDTRPGGWLRSFARPKRSLTPGEVAAGPVTTTTRSGVRIHGIQTGVLAIKRAHARLRHPAALRLLSIVLDPTWTPLLPILTWVIEHPEGLFVIDTGERAAASDIDSYMAADPANRWFFKRNLPMFVTPAEELAAQMRGLGLPREAVQTVVLTHLHGDHAGGLGFFPNAEFLVGRAEYEGHLRQPMGAVRSLWPAGWAPRLVEYDGPGLGPFRATLPLTRTGDLMLLPTPGHSYGHQSVLLIDGERSYLFAGDLAFSEAQLRGRGLQGIAQDLGQARATLERTWHYVRGTPTVFLPSHDPQALRRLRDGVITSPLASEQKRVRAQPRS